MAKLDLEQDLKPYIDSLSVQGFEKIFIHIYLEFCLIMLSVKDGKGINFEDDEFLNDIYKEWHQHLVRYEKYRLAYPVERLSSQEIIKLKKIFELMTSIPNHTLSLENFTKALKLEISMAIHRIGIIERHKPIQKSPYILIGEPGLPFFECFIDMDANIEK